MDQSRNSAWKSHVEPLKRGGIGVIPTDTLYGVVARAGDHQAVERIYKLKGRDGDKPFIILIDRPERLADFGVETDLKQLAEYWPGPVSLILSVPDARFDYLSRGKHSLAFRMPDRPELLDFLSQTGPLVAPSANPQGEEPARTIQEAEAYFGGQVDFYIDGGTRQGAPSRLIDLTGPAPKILR